MERLEPILAACARFRDRAGGLYDASCRAVLFGSRARGDADADSDVDLAVVVDLPMVDVVEEKRRLARLAYDVFEETGVLVSAWPVTETQWSDPATHANPALVRAMRRDGVAIP